jgi:hypothetical protein
MKFVQAFLALGLFGGLAFAVFTGSLPQSDGGSSKSRALMTMVNDATARFGPDMTALGLMGFGALIALYCVSRRA